MSADTPSIAQATKVWAKVGVLSFGGPAAQISLMHREVVDDRKWLSEQQFLNALSFCMLLPGPEAMQLATYAGWRLHGVLGGLIAGLLFVLPGALVMLVLSALYAAFGQVPLVDALFLGIKATVVIIVIEALLKVSKRALHSKAHWIIAAFAFIGIFALKVPYPLIVIAAGLYGYIFARKPDTETISPPLRQPVSATLKTITLWLGIWFAPLLALRFTLPSSILNDIGIFFSKLAVVTFGGAYAVLAYMGQDVVENSAWLTAGQMMDGLGLAETTPGPLILVTQFVGYIAAHSEGGYWLGMTAALITLWATFVPCFLWIFVGAPYIDWISTRPRLKGALTAITAAVVGVILNLSIWFALHVFFGSVETFSWGLIEMSLPDLTTINWRAVIIAVGAGIALLKFHTSIVKVLLPTALAGWLTSLF